MTDTIERTTTTGTMRVIDPSGDTRVMWDRNNADEVAAARRTFRDLLAKGHLAYKAEGKKGAKGEQIREFDPDAERVILVPQMAGG